MKKITILITLFFINIESVHADVPEQFIGKWSVTFKAKEGFPWWTQIKYPKHMDITQGSIKLNFGHGLKCTPKMFLYDDEIDAVVIKHCLPKKSELAFTPVFIFRKNEKKLIGEVVTYKELFELEGVLIK